jgi:predicted alpha/beta hydrolase
MLGWHPGMAGVARVITVGSGLVHVGDHPAGFRLLARAFWHGMPLLARAWGYLPGWAGLGPDIPLGVYQDWRRWCLSPGFHLSDVGSRLTLPDPALVQADMRIIAVSDDAWVPPAAVWRLMALYPRAIKRQRVLRPADHGLRAIGHLGAFSRRNSVVWPAMVD